MLKLFEMAESQRDENLKDIPLHILMESAAKEAGWHQVIVPNLNRKEKTQTRYERPFSSAVTAELICRTRNTITNALRKREIDPSTINSHLGWGVFCFIKSYNPEKHNTDEKIVASIYQAVLTKITQFMRKEDFKYRPGYTGVTNKERELAEKEGRAPKARYTDTPKEFFSLNQPVYNKDSDQTAEMGDFISGERDFTLEIEDRETEEELAERYCSNKYQKFFLKILIDLGSSGKVGRSQVVQISLRNPGYVHSLKLDISQDRGCPIIAISNEDLISMAQKQVKVFYRGLKKKLNPNL